MAATTEEKRKALFRLSYRLGRFRKYCKLIMMPAYLKVDILKTLCKEKRERCLEINSRCDDRTTETRKHTGSILYVRDLSWSRGRYPSLIY